MPKIQINVNLETYEPLSENYDHFESISHSHGKWASIYKELSSGKFYKLELNLFDPINPVEAIEVEPVIVEKIEYIVVED